MRELDGTRSTTKRLTVADARNALFRCLKEDDVATALRARGLVIEGDHVFYCGENGEIRELEITGK